MGIAEVIISCVVGLVVGILGTVAVQKGSNQEPVVVESHKGTEQAIQQLTELDLTKPVCEPKYIQENGELLCRELICLQMTRGLDSKTAGEQCESISNISNKIQIEKWCNQYQDESLKQDCIELFWKRN